MSETLELMEVTPTTETRAIAERAVQAVAVAKSSPADLLRIAIERGDGDLDRLERLMNMQAEWQRSEDERTMTDRMAEFKRNPPDIVKRKLVSFNDTSYRHAEHSDVTLPIIEALGKIGISHRWVPHQRDGWVGITCVLKFGTYSESTVLEAPPDASGKKNTIQAIVSTKTYLERHTLLAACGLTTRDMRDDDGRGAGDGEASGVDPVLQKGRDAALEGTDSLTDWWGGLNNKQRSAWQKEFGALRKVAADADRRETRHAA